MEANWGLPRTRRISCHSTRYPGVCYQFGTSHALLTSLLLSASPNAETESYFA